MRISSSGLSSTNNMNLLFIIPRGWVLSGWYRGWSRVMRWIQSLTETSQGSMIERIWLQRTAPALRAWGGFLPNLLANIVHKSRYATRTVSGRERVVEGALVWAISTISNQYLPSDLVTLTSVSKVTGLTRYMSAPKLRARQKSSSALEAVSTTTGMVRKSASALISASASRPSLRGMLRSRRIRPGRGESGALLYRPR